MSIHLRESSAFISVCSKSYLPVMKNFRQIIFCLCLFSFLSCFSQKELYPNLRIIDTHSEMRFVFRSYLIIPPLSEYYFMLVINIFSINLSEILARTRSKDFFTQCIRKQNQTLITIVFWDWGLVALLYILSWDSDIKNNLGNHALELLGTFGELLVVLGPCTSHSGLHWYFRADPSINLHGENSEAIPFLP